MGKDSRSITREQMPVFLTLACVGFTVFMDKYLIGFTVKRLCELYAMPTSEASFMLSAFYAGFIVASLVGGYLVDKYGSKLFMALTIGLLAVVSLAFGFVTTLPWFIVLRACAGLGQSSYVAGLPKVMRRCFSAEQVPYVQAKIGAVCGVGGIVAATAGQWLLSMDETWWSAYVALSVGFAVTMLLVLRFVPARDVSERGQAVKVSLRDAWASKPTVVLALAYGFNNVVVVAMINWLPSVTAGLPGAGSVPSGAVMIGFYVVEAITLYFSANIIRGRFWYRTTPLIIVTALLGAVGLVLFVTATTFAASVVMLYAATVFVLLSDAAILILPYRYIPEAEIASSVAFVSVGGFVGGLVSPFVVNLFSNGASTDFVAAFAVYAVVLVASSLFVLLLPKLDAENDLLG